MADNPSDTNQPAGSGRRLPLWVWAVPLLFVLLAVLLGAWYASKAPHRAFDAARRESVDRLAWSGKNSEDQYRTGQIVAALEQAEYADRDAPRLAYAALLGQSGHLVVDWVAGDRPTNVRAIEISGDATAQLPVDADYVEHGEGTLMFTTSVRQVDNQEAWPDFAKSGKYQVNLLLDGDRKSNKIALRIAD